MGIDYVIDYDCQPKRALGLEALIGMVKARTQAESLLAMMREKGENRHPSEIKLTSIVRRPTGEERVEISLQQMYDRGAPLDGQSQHCRACPACVGNAPYGCYGYVSYPVPAATEQWMCSLFPKQPESTGGFMLASAMRDFGWDGAPAANMRSQGDTFFESRTPIRFAVGQGAGALQLTADQVFHMFFQVGPIEPGHGMMLCLFTGLLPHTLPPNELGPLTKDRNRLGAMLRDTTSRLQAPQGSHASAVARLLTAMACAVALDKRLIIDG